MPIYEYQCQECKKKHEIIQPYSENPVEQCPSCGGSMKKLISSPAIQFKGSGFYKTDYPSASSGAGATKASSESKGDSKSETKSESKSETSSKSESKSETTTATKASE